MDGGNHGLRLRLRPVEATDEPLLAQLFAEARAGEFHSTGLGERELSLLLEIQRRAQESQYRAAFPQAERSIIEVDGAAVGRLVLDRGPEEMRVVDVALLAVCRGRGLGSSLLRALQAEAAASGRRLGLRVAQGNPARRLYARLGFREVRGDEMYVEMAWQPGSSGHVGDSNPNNRGAAA